MRKNSMILWCLLPYLAVSAARGDEAVTPPEMARRIAAAFASVKSAHVQWEVQTEVPPSPAARDAQHFSIYPIDEFAWSGERRYRKHVQLYDRRSGPYVRIESTYCFDGQVTRAQCIDIDEDGEATPENYHVFRGSDAGIAGQREQAAVYLECIGSPFYDGRYLDVWRRERGRTREHIDAARAKHPFSVVAALSAGDYQLGSEASIDGIDCVVVERPDLDRIWLSPAMNYAVVQREWRWDFGEPLMMKYVNSDFANVGGDLWLPRQAVRTGFMDSRRFKADPQQVAFQNTCRIVGVTIDQVDDSLFEITPVPGSTAVDNTRLGSSSDPILLTYVVGANPQDTEKSVARMVQHRQRMSWQALKFWSWSGGEWVFALNVCAIGAIVTYVWRRRRVVRV